MPKPVETMFLYPPHGVGRFSDLLAEGILAMGGRVILGESVTVGRDRRLAHHRRAHRARAHRLRQIVWTAPLTTLNTLLGLKGMDLEYLSTIFYNLEIGSPPKIDYQWTYFGGDEIFSRVTSPEAFLTRDHPAGQERVVRGVHLPRGRRALAESRALHAADHCRPGPHEGHRRGRGRRAGAHRAGAVHVSDLQAELPGRADPQPARSRAYSNLLLAGRCGRFWYNNMDHSIGQGLTMADKILQRRSGSARSTRRTASSGRLRTMGTCRCARKRSPSRSRRPSIVRRIQTPA